MTDQKQPTALDLPMVDPLPEATQKYFDICTEKLGMIPNVLKANAFNIDKLNAFTTQMRDELIAAFDLTDADDSVRAVIVTGAGRGTSPPSNSPST